MTHSLYLKKYLMGIVMIYLIITSTTIFASQSVLPIQQIIHRKTLIIALPQLDHSLFFTKNKKGKLQGISITIAKQLAHELGVKVAFNRQAKTFDDVVNVIARGNADIAICNLSETLPRAKKILFSTPYMTLHQTLLVNRLWMSTQHRTLGIKDPLDLIRKAHIVIGVIANSAYVPFAKTMFSNATIKTYDSWKQATQALIHKKVNAIYHDDLEIKKFLLDHPNLPLNYKAIIFTQKEDWIGMGIAKKNLLLIYWLNSYLRLKKINLDVDDILTENQV